MGDPRRTQDVVEVWLPNGLTRELDEGNQWLKKDQVENWNEKKKVRSFIEIQLFPFEPSTILLK